MMMHPLQASFGLTAGHKGFTLLLMGGLFFVNVNTRPGLLVFVPVQIGALVVRVVLHQLDDQSRARIYYGRYIVAHSLVGLLWICVLYCAHNTGMRAFPAEAEEVGPIARLLSMLGVASNRVMALPVGHRLVFTSAA